MERVNNEVKQKRWILMVSRFSSALHLYFRWHWVQQSHARWGICSQTHKFFFSVCLFPANKPAKHSKLSSICHSPPPRFVFHQGRPHCAATCPVICPFIPFRSLVLKEDHAGDTLPKDWGWGGISVSPFQTTHSPARRSPPPPSPVFTQIAPVAVVILTV